MSFMLYRVISGGQTGVDQVGLEVARALGYQTGGTAPKDWRTDEGPMEDLLKGYGLIESQSFHYGPRTRANVAQSDGTVWFGKPTSPGGRLTIRLADDYARCLLVNPSPVVLRSWLIAHSIRVLNVAGNRRRINPDAAVLARQVLTIALHPSSTPTVPLC